MAHDVIYDVEAKVLSPLHIGTGTTLMQDYDFVVRGKQTYRLNVDAILEEMSRSPRLKDRLSSIPPGSLLQKDSDFAEDRLFHYVMEGTPRSETTGTELREQIKDAWHQPYLPGSSLKGALRTALLWNAARGRRQPVRQHELARGSKRAAQPLEKGAFRLADVRDGDTANYDLLRAIQVSDSEPIGKDALRVFVAYSFTRRGPGVPISLEAVAAGNTFRLRVKIDGTLFDSLARARGLDYGGAREGWLRSLPQIVQAFARARVDREIAWLRRGRVDGAERLIQFYEARRDPKADNDCYLQVGWGAGWLSKTIGVAWDAGDPDLAEILRSNRMLRRGQSPASFPSSRTLIRLGQTGPQAPLGWLRLRFLERQA